MRDKAPGNEKSTSRIDTLLEQMTLEEQVALLAGADLWRTAAIPRLNIPALKVSDGPAGARGGGSLTGGKRTAAFPIGIALGSSWNEALLQEVGGYLAREALDKGAGVLLAPTVNLFRSSLNGRNFEGYSEDPYLAGKLAAAYIRGLQAQGVAATVKHFAGNESEYQRRTISSDIPERALRELYLLPFELAVKEGGTWAIMTGYNKLNGTYSSENHRLLTEILRKEWSFDGLVMSDWGGTHTAGESLRAGLDLEMPGPSKARKTLLPEAQADASTGQAVRRASRNVLQLLERTRTLAEPRDVNDTAERDEEYSATRGLIRRAGAEGMVLLKNSQGLLPLPENATVTVIGPNAATAQVMGGGSAQINAHRRVSPIEGLQEALGEANVTYAVGCENEKLLPALMVAIQVEYRAADSTEILLQEERSSGELIWFGPHKDVPHNFEAKATAVLTIEEAGEYELSLASAGLSYLAVDGQKIIENWETFQPGNNYFGYGSNELRVRHFLSPGEHRVAAEFKSRVTATGITQIQALRLGFRKPLPARSIAEAAELAAKADYAVVCIGTTGEWETEGVDRVGLDLPGRQDELVRAVVNANPNTIVLLQTGGPVLMPWLDHVSTVLQAWFPGQEAGHSISDVLLGKADPGGRLPQSFPACLADDPVHPEQFDRQYPGEDGHVEYREGLYIGYRHFDQGNMVPLFPFGFGLSYTTFVLSEPQLEKSIFEPGEELPVTLNVRNAGERPGQTVIQLYVKDLEARLERPEKELKAFAKVSLKPGETQVVILRLNMRSLAYYDDNRAAWVAEAGDFELLIGTSSDDLPHRITLTLLREWVQPATN